MGDQDFDAVLNAELGEGSPYRFTAHYRSHGYMLVMLDHETRGVVVHPPDECGNRCEFWWKDRQQARGCTAEVAAIAGAARLWAEGAGLLELSTRYPFVKFSDLQLAYEQGNAREFQWRTVLQDAEGLFANYSELVRLASENPTLRRLFPQVGHRFVLSENEDSTDVLFSVFMIRPDWYAIYAKDGDGFEVEGEARKIVEFLTSAVRARGVF